MKKGWIIIVSIALVLIALAAYFAFLYTPKCSSSVCFSDSLINCKRASYISDNPQTVMQYTILGTSSGKCEINVKLLQIKTGGPELSVLENKEMLCSTDIGVLISPEKNLKNCHGLLKEAIQEITIERMHTQLFQNLEDIQKAESII